MTDISKKTVKKPRGRPFKQGVSGNPGGRPKKTQEERDLIAEMRSDLLPKAVDCVRDILDDPGVKPEIKLKAAELVFQRTRFGEDAGSTDSGQLIVIGDKDYAV